jgi:hypothetical protein
MLSFFSNRHDNRRAFLRVGSLGMAGLSLESLLQGMALADHPSRLLKDRSVIFLFLHGGPSQTETFDPKMTAPAGIHSATGEVRTKLPGVTFGGTFPQLANLADKFSIVRSFQTGDGNHDIKPIVSKHSLHANLGTLYARIAGTTNPTTNTPSNVALFPRSVDPSTQPENNSFGKFAAAGSLGASYQPFVLGGGGLHDDMKIQIAATRMGDRRTLLRELDRSRVLLDSANKANTIDRFREQAFDTIISGAAQAFDLSQEDPQIVSAYDTAPLVRPDQISRRWNNYNNYVDNAKSLGKLLLLARRLCERGCRFVTVTTNFVWDMHADINNAGVAEGMEYMGRPLDHALATFIRDVESRGLRDRIMLVACGEMGRTPTINASGGRDHWGRIAPLLIYGGDLKMGRVVGQSTKDAGAPATAPYGISHLVATIMHELITVSELRLQTNLPTDLIRLVTSSQPINELT